VNLLLAGRIARGGTATEGWIEVRRGRIEAVRAGTPPRVPDEPHAGLIAPGLVDVQVNGGAGVQVTDGHRALDRLEEALLAHGVTSYLPTLISAPDEAMALAAEELAERVADPASPAAGVHLEGPFLSPEHAGVHRAELLVAPAGRPLPLAYASPALALVTLAPELDGALQLVRALRQRGVAVSLGHSGADAVTARAAFGAGASMVTHVFDAMAPLHHRAPGLAGAALVHPSAHVGVIADGHHVDPLVLELVRRAAGPRVVLVSDASPAAVAPPGRYLMGEATIERAADGTARTPGGMLGGSAILLDEAVRRWAALTGATLTEAIAAAAEAPGRVIALPPPLAPGAPADLVLFDDGGTVVRVMRHGAWVT
jgi:N-acetylglucosamine-6-phosphate deacetylase